MTAPAVIFVRYNGYMILGIDEVGRGPWAGPLVVGAVVLGDASIPGLNDSKKLSAKRREALNELILASAAGWGLGWVHADELDAVGLSAALRLATTRAVEKIKTPYHEIIIDGTVNFLKETSKGAYVTMLPKADSLIPSVSAASIIAKVARDRFMAEQDTVHPGYGFSSHVGYGTAAHKSALLKLGVTPLHRRSFAPIAAIVRPVEESTGRVAEALAVKYLQAQGHQLVARNWRTKFCEIDIISEHAGRLYFTEVKYRKRLHAGDGLAAITNKKLKQMRFAANLYLARYPLQQPAKLAAIAVAGDPMRIETFLEIE